MRIRALLEADFNDADHKARRLAAGDELETGDDYGARLVALGLAEPVTDAPDAEPEGEPEPETAPAEPARTGKRTGKKA